MGACPPRSWKFFQSIIGLWTVLDLWRSMAMFSRIFSTCVRLLGAPSFVPLSKFLATPLSLEMRLKSYNDGVIYYWEVCSHKQWLAKEQTVYQKITIHMGRDQQARVWSTALVALVTRVNKTSSGLTKWWSKARQRPQRTWRLPSL